MPIFKLLLGRPSKVFFSTTAFLGGMFRFFLAYAGYERENDRRSEKEGKVDGGCEREQAEKPLPANMDILSIS